MSTSESANQSIEILIAEDSPTQAERLKYTLTSHGFRVTPTTNGRFALAAARLRRPSLIISDVMMPEMDGYELCRTVKSDPDLQQIPVILLTTLSNPQDVVRGLECLADNFILKPYDEEYLLSRIYYVIANQQIRPEDRVGVGVEIYFGGNRHFITADRLQILNLLLSTYEAVLQKNRELVNARDELRESNAALENANRELEAFGYTVSHDLRSPLRAIDGYSAILAEECGNKLNEEERRVLNTIREGAKNMGRLIDDLLAFSRLGRKEIEGAKVDMDQLVEEIVVQLRPAADQAKRFRIGTLPAALGDRALLRQVLSNLLSNAAKYSEKSANPVIEVGCSGSNGTNGGAEGFGGHDSQHHENIYYVKDNGVGFDMKYADKLFGVFQRLHSPKEFEGTGVGLAIVQRIIQRHGGRIWANSKPNEGATFYFTLPSA